MLKSLKNIYQREKFHPTWLGIFVNPFYFARSHLDKAIQGLAIHIKGKLLDVGCGSKPYKNYFTNIESYTGLEIDSERSRKRNIADFYYDGNCFPFKDKTFDVLLCNQVIEHVFNPDFFLQEINRVLKPNGKLLLTVPFVWDEHEQPFDYARYSSFGLKFLLERSDFYILVHRKLGADATVLFQLINAYLFKITSRWSKYLRFLFTITIMALVNLIGIVLCKILPTNPDLFLDHIVLAEKKF
jgi:SAM-dependent methyltransferase